jgi:mannose-6-phosphate isomerase
LQPYEAIYMDAGIMHAYLMGSGLEVMANSDNVLRCALTSKHIDVLELMKIARLSPEEPQYIKPAIIDIENRYITPAREFQVSHFKLKHPVKINISSPEIILAIKGKLKITTSETHHLTIYRGQSAFITPSARSYKIVGDAEFFRVFTPL